MSDETVHLSDAEATALGMQLVIDLIEDGAFLPGWEDVPMIDEDSWRRVEEAIRRTPKALVPVVAGLESRHDIDVREIKERAS